MDLGTSLGQLLMTVIRMLIMPVLKLVFKLLMFVGFYWIALMIVLILVIEWMFGSINSVVMDALLIIGLILMLLTTAQNLIRMIKKDRSFNIYRIIFSRIVKDGKKGIESKIDGKVIALKSAGDLSGIVFGKKGDKYITKPELADGHALIIGGAGSGKTSAIAIPTLMSWKDRVFAIDIKGELFEKTNAFRNKGNIKVFNPTDCTAFGYDPFYMLHHTDDISGEARALALSICPLPADVKDPFWIKSSQNMLTGFILYFFGIDFSFSETMAQIKSKPVKDTVAEIMTSDNRKAIAEVSQFAGMDDKTLSGVFAELSNHITIFATNDDLQHALDGSGECITPADLENGYDIYCCIPEHKLDQWKDLLGMMCNQFLKAFERRPDMNKNPILFLIDEFPRLGKIETVSNGLATLRSRKINIALCVQSKSQLNAIYGNDIAEVIADNCSYKAILKASEPNTQEWCSKLVGTYDKHKKSSNYNADVFGLGKGQGTSTTTEEKRIIKPEEFAYLQDVVCVFPNGYRRIDKIKYWEDRAFMK